MPVIRANRDSVDDRFSVLGFSIRTEAPLYEVGIASDPDLFRPEAKARRNRHNFYSSRAAGGALRARRGEAVYLVPPDVMLNFVGQPKLYYGLATYGENSGGTPNFVQNPTTGNMFVNIASLSERGLRRLASRPSGSTSYGANGASLVWGGDASATATPVQSQTPSPAVDASALNGKAAPAPAAAASLAYDDGFGAFPPRAQAVAPRMPAGIAEPRRGLRALSEEDYESDQGGGIDGPIPDDGAPATSQGVRALAAQQPEYPGASRFTPAHPSNYRALSTTRSIEHIVIHITDGGSKITGTIGWFQNPDQRNSKNQPIHVSAHYVIGQDGEVVQMVRNNDVAWHASQANAHAIGIEHVANKKGLNPTEAQYQASAGLVAWLCGQFGLPADRDHIVGHYEISPRDNHDCPSKIWDWDHYMDLVAAAAAPSTAGAQEPTAQSLGVAGRNALRRRGVVRAQEIITPFYDPKDPASALTCQNNAFSLAREEWFIGVDDTRSFPHSAICQINTVDSAGNGWGGTGFYIGRNRILTAAHVLSGMVTATIIPGKNGSAEPFGHCTVNSSSWRVAPTYTGGGNYENDLAVIDNVPIAAPNGQWFGFLNATPSDQLPIVVCGYSAASDAVPELTQAIDGDKQHLHGGYARSMSNPEVIEYPILTLHGASGAPVYHLDSGSGQLQALICAVHVTGAPAAQGLNRGCFITPTKIDWIEGRATAFALDAATSLRRGYQARSTPARAPSSNPTQSQPRSSAQGLLDLLPVDLKLRLFIPAPVVIETVPVVGSRIPGRDAHGGDGRSFQFEGGTSRAEVTATFHFGGDGTKPSLTDISRRFGESFNYDSDDTIEVDGKPSWYRDLRAGAKPTKRGTQTLSDSKLSIVLGGSSNDGIISIAENAVVVTFEVHANNPIVTGSPDIDATLAVLLKVDGDRVKARLRGGHDEFPAYELYANGKLVYSYDPVAAGASPWGLVGDGNWDVNPETDYVDVGPASEYRIIGPVRIGDTAQALSASRALANECYSIHWDTVPYYPQQTDASCWAAAAAMVVAWRDGVTISDADIAAKVPAIDAYRNGLWPSDRHQLADVWDLVPEPPASYTIDAWRDMLQTYGPLWLDMTNSAGTGGHAWVLVGMTSDGAEDGSDTVMYLHNPSPSRGKVKWKFPDFLKLYEGRVGTEGNTLECQILHSASVPEGRRTVTAAPFSLSLAADSALRLTKRAAARAMSSDGSDYPAVLVPQPDKLSCWAASMTMLLSFRRKASYTPESLANEVGQSLMQSYGWDLLTAVRERYGFTAVEVPSNTSLYFDAAQWATWLQQYGPLWVVIVGMPHAVVVSGLRGDTGKPDSVEVHILNPWDTRVAFDSDPVAFNPPNQGYDSWQPFNQFASDFGNMAEPNYGNWRILYVPASAAAAQSLGTVTRARSRWAAPPPKVRALGADLPGADTSPESTIEPTRVPGTTMRACRGQSGRVRWALDQLDGMKSPDPAPAVIGVAVDNTLALDRWPAYGSDPVPLPLTVRWAGDGAAVGNVRIEAGAATSPNYDVEVTATIDNDTDPLPSTKTAMATLKLIVEYRFRGTPDGDRTARSDIRIYGNGGHDRESRWL